MVLFRDWGEQADVALEIARDWGLPVHAEPSRPLARTRPSRRCC